MAYFAPWRSQLRPYNRAYAYRGLTVFASLSLVVSDRHGAMTAPNEREQAKQTGAEQVNSGRNRNGAQDMTVAYRRGIAIGTFFQCGLVKVVG
jgi:hypothetical protein